MAFLMLWIQLLLRSIIGPAAVSSCKNTPTYTGYLYRTAPLPQVAMSDRCLFSNGSYPGPTLEVDWGDTLVVHVTKELQYNDISVHWHCITQLGSSQYDGTFGVSQCLIAPGEAFTYKFRTTQYGTAWYRSHFSLQMADATADYDIDLGLVFITDWFHKSAFKPVSTGSPKTVLSTGPTPSHAWEKTQPARGMGAALKRCSKRAKKKYRIHLIDSGIDGWMKLSIDGHKLTVIATDLVPIVPYETESVLITWGQRYDIVVEANQDSGNYWMRAVYQTPCNGLKAEHNDIRGIIRYEQTLNMSFTYKSGHVYQWTVNTKPLNID
ncbi:hypothetical protein NUU61_003223 [Penicillium alfredii]|uniref:Uncharacterized protein n=1 Tax=Penicillium alfredii TaxID=1506179 RepID=A0A9W9FSY9_9EURO|nr:uncharacterized protein NUU61_003223 [Penicillium alfredii]KAJ5105876.1 hypothetical protein NUU61_003223 [Penicillium alfredii]